MILTSFLLLAFFSSSVIGTGEPLFFMRVVWALDLRATGGANCIYGLVSRDTRQSLFGREWEC